jgi:serine/threonine-protein kinase RsbW
LIRPISPALAAAAVDSAAAISNPATITERIRVSSSEVQDIAQLRQELEAEAAARLLADAAAVSRAVRLAHGFAARTGLEPTVAGHLAVVVEEWVANVVEHGGPQDGARIVLRLRLTEGVVRLTVSDAGRPFDPRTAAFDGPNHERGGGAGLAMISNLCRIAGYARRAGRNRLELELPLGL